MRAQPFLSLILSLVAALATPPSASAQHHAAAAAPASENMLPAQVFLDRAGFSSGEIDGRNGRNTRNAIAAFERAKGTSLKDAMASSTEPATRAYLITAQDVATPLTPSIPEDMMQKAKLPRLGYTSLEEMIAERFHASPQLLMQLNPSASFTVGEQITVPNVDVVVDAQAPPTPNIVVRVSKRLSTLTVTNAAGEILLQAPVTSGSQHDPLPFGMWRVTAVVRNPTFNYNPALFWDADPTHAKAKVPAGENNPVGVVWIDINKPHYGIHGTPEPDAIGHVTSHGCVRMTNWDVLRLAALVGKGTKVEFVR